jgi:hypothetical protein
MGRSFESVRMGAKEVSARWFKAKPSLDERGPVLREEADRIDKKHSNELWMIFGGGGFYSHTQEVVIDEFFPPLLLSLERSFLAPFGFRFLPLEPLFFILNHHVPRAQK